MELFSIITVNWGTPELFTIITVNWGTPELFTIIPKNWDAPGTLHHHNSELVHYHTDRSSSLLS